MFFFLHRYLTNQASRHSQRRFHCDEALSCFMIQLTNKFSAAQIVRTRDPQVLDTLDVGGVYDPSRGRFDHHQKGLVRFLVTDYSPLNPVVRAGLVYKRNQHRILVVQILNGRVKKSASGHQHYGVEIIAKVIQLDEGHPDVYRLYLAVYKSFIEAGDSIDNGINQYDVDLPPRYVNNTSLSSRVERLNLDLVDPDQSPEREK